MVNIHPLPRERLEIYVKLDSAYPLSVVEAAEMFASDETRG